MRKAILILLLILAASAPVLWDRGLLKFHVPDRARFPIRGIDVSHHQGKIDWRRVARDDVTFAYIKASEGGDWRDRTFRRNSREAARAGVRTGAYHFFSLCRPGGVQAENFLAAIDGETLRLAPAVDLEFGGNCAVRPAKADFERELAVFMAQVQAETGRRPILYVTKDFRHFYLKGGRFEREAYWVRDLVIPFRRPLKSRLALWQYDARGRVAGIEGPVDLNLAARLL